MNSYKIVVLGLSYCPFTKKAFDYLDENDIKYESQIIDCCKEDLKKRHFFSTFPQIFVDGKLLGGYEKVKELNENGFFGDNVLVPEVVDRRKIGYKAACIEINEESALHSRYNQYEKAEESKKMIKGVSDLYKKGPCTCVTAG